MAATDALTARAERRGMLRPGTCVLFVGEGEVHPTQGVIEGYEADLMGFPNYRIRSHATEQVEVVIDGNVVDVLRDDA